MSTWTKFLRPKLIELGLEVLAYKLMKKEKSNGTNGIEPTTGTDSIDRAKDGSHAGGHESTKR